MLAVIIVATTVNSKVLQIKTSTKIFRDKTIYVNRRFEYATMVAERGLVVLCYCLKIKTRRLKMVNELGKGFGVDNFNRKNDRRNYFENYRKMI